MKAPSCWFAPVNLNWSVVSFLSSADTSESLGGNFEEIIDKAEQGTYFKV